MPRPPRIARHHCARPTAAAAVESVEPRLLFAALPPGNIFEVTNTNDAGPGSFREAITEANAHVNADVDGDTFVDVDEIYFNIPGPGPHTIQVGQTTGQALPAVTEAVIIDGETRQAGSVELGPPVVELVGTLAGAGANGLTINASDTFLLGLSVNRFAGHGIVANGDLITILNTNVGTSRTPTDPTVAGRPGLTALGNGGDGVRLNGTDNFVGTSVIAFNGGAGVSVLGGSGNDVAAVSVFRNAGEGIDLAADGFTANDNGNPPTTPPDQDTGPNRRLNFPVINSITNNPNGTTTVQGFIDTEPGLAVDVALYTNDVEEREGRALLLVDDAFPTTPLNDGVTNASGRGTFTITVPTASILGYLTATAEASLDGFEEHFQSVSEFAAAVPVPGTGIPHVTDVFVSGSAWTPADANPGTTTFMEYVEARGLGDRRFGFRVTDGGPNSNELPWTNLNTVTVRFDRDVTVDAADVIVRNASTGTPFALSGAPAYDSATDTLVIRLAQPLQNQRVEVVLDGDPGGVTATDGGRLLDGDFTNFLPSGDGSAGGDFAFRFNVLPGDVDRNGAVNIFDTLATRNRQGTSTTSPGTAPNTYTPFHDVDGNGAINIFDTLAVRNRQGTSLPAVVAAASPFGTASIVDRLKEDDVLA